MNATVNYYDQNAKSWASAHDDQLLWKQYMDQLHELLPAGHILEIGCGGGRDAQELIKLGYQYTGIDPAEGMIEIAAKRNPTGRFIKGSVAELDFTELFDGFWAAASLLHVPKVEIKQALQKINSVTKLEGIGFIALKKHVDDRDDERIETDEYGSRLFTYWNKDSFIAELKDAGYELATEATEVSMSAKTVWLLFIVRKVK